MNLEKSLNSRSYLFFLVFFGLAIFGFWLTYFTRLDQQPSYRMHTHGAGMILWCLMLIAQGLLIRMKKNAWHRLLGKASFLLVPFIVWSTLDLLRFTLMGILEFGPLNYYFIALVVNALVAFVLFYGLGIFHVYKRQTGVHARYMLCTVFPMVTPVTDRIIHIHFPELLRFVPVIQGAPIAPALGFLLADILVLALCIWDWTAHRRWNVFPVVLLVLVLYHVSVLQFYRYGFWQRFCEWLF